MNDCGGVPGSGRWSSGRFDKTSRLMEKVNAPKPQRSSPHVSGRASERTSIPVVSSLVLRVLFGGSSEGFF